MKSETLIYIDPPYGLGDKKSFNKDQKDYEDDVPFDLTKLDFFKNEFVSQSRSPAIQFSLVGLLSQTNQPISFLGNGNFS